MSKRGKAIFAIVTLVVTILMLVVARHFDFPLVADAAPRPVANVIDGKDARCYVYSLGGFLDKEFLWRIDSDPKTITAILDALKMYESPTIPEAFWEMPPSYWPRTLSKEMKPYRSQNFMDNARGADGDHFFLLHDTVANRAYVWFRNNF